MLKTPEQRERARLEMLERKEKKRAATRRKAARAAIRKRRNVLRAQTYRKRKKAEAKAALRAARKAKREAQAVRRAARKEKHDRTVRSNARPGVGFVDGYSAATPKTPLELKALSYSRAYIARYLEGVAEKQRVTQLLNQEATRQPTPAPATIQLP
jgi:hypothetical protein